MRTLAIKVPSKKDTTSSQKNKSELGLACSRANNNLENLCVFVDGDDLERWSKLSRIGVISTFTFFFVLITGNASLIGTSSTVVGFFIGVRFALTPGAGFCILPWFCSAKDFLLLHGICQLVDRIFNSTG